MHPSYIKMEDVNSIRDIIECGASENICKKRVAIGNERELQRKDFV